MVEWAGDNDTCEKNGKKQKPLLYLVNELVSVHYFFLYFSLSLSLSLYLPTTAQREKKQRNKCFSCLLGVAVTHDGTKMIDIRPSI